MALKLDHVTLLSSKLEDSMRYYDALLPLLGFSKLRNHVWTDGEGFFFQFRAAKSGTTPYERHGAGMNHLGFSVASPDEVSAIRSQMAEAGFEVPEIQNLGGVTALFMKDPDGIRFEISHYPEGTSVVD
ncbi:VOC family protein [Dokdonella sp.]|uniref:VOC family protein n=1 Tax=Dokdonella sp. TaxID=2291710 RepID=UPI003529C46D